MNYYAKAIDILNDKETDLVNIAITLAKKHPKLFIEYAKNKQLLFEDEIFNIFNTQGKTPAAIFYRNEKCTSLNDSVDEVMRIVNEMGWK